MKKEPESPDELKQRAREFFSDYSDAELMLRDTLDRGRVVELLVAFAFSIQEEGQQINGTCKHLQHKEGQQ